VWRSDLKPRRNVARNGSSVERHAGRVARKASPWIERLARVGYVAKGALYVVIGFLALREALGLGRETTGPSSAFRSIGSQPFGSLMVALLASPATRCGSLCKGSWTLTRRDQTPTASCGASDTSGAV
jgi:hypothetical protein